MKENYIGFELHLTQMDIFSHGKIRLEVTYKWDITPNVVVVSPWPLNQPKKIHNF
jgi:hypothetical protein